MKKTVHIISHSHWDREWYRAFERHRMKLIDLIDESMDLFDQDSGFQNFHAGPWYILQDEFLTSPESNIRNLLIGMQEAEEFGKACKIGYFPDAFGNAGQMPQILKQAGMEAIVFGRGVKPVGFDNMALGGEYESFYSEMMWESPDGSSLPGLLKLQQSVWYKA